MGRKHRRGSQEKDLTARLLAGELDEDRIDPRQRFSARSAGAQQRKIEQTALLRLAEQEAEGDIESLPVGQVAQAFSLYYDVEFEGSLRLCVVRKTMARLRDSGVVTGDYVRFRETGLKDEAGRPEAVIEQVLPRRTVLAKTESFKGREMQPVVANAEQMLIVAALVQPEVRWGLIDRIIVAAQGGGLRPVVVMNKIDLAEGSPSARKAYAFAEEALGHYQSLGIATLRTSVLRREGLDELREMLRGKTTVLAGHSGVGKSSLINAVVPGLDIHTRAVSGYTGKGLHTTTSAKRYLLDFGGYVIDTPGVRMFGLWGVTAEGLTAHFPDVEAGTAPQWRVESYQRIRESMEEP